IVENPDLMAVFLLGTAGGLLAALGRFAIAPRVRATPTLGFWVDFLFFILVGGFFAVFVEPRTGAGALLAGMAGSYTYEVLVGSRPSADQQTPRNDPDRRM